MDNQEQQATGWHFVENGQAAGPVTQDELAALAQAGRIRPETLVWRAGMPGWVAYATIGGGAPAGPVPEGAAVCGFCKRVFPKDDLIAFENTWICASCKPTFVQNLKENAELPMAMVYGGFWIRVAAMIIDGLLLTIVRYAVTFLPMIFGMKEGMLVAVQLVAMIAGLLISAGYEIWMVGRFGATLGKMACRLKVVTAEGRPPGYARATGRYFAKIVSQLTLFVGFILVAFDREKRGLHDMMCNTRVIRVEA